MNDDKQVKLELFITKYIDINISALYDIGVGPKSEWKTLGGFYKDLQVFGVEANPDMCDLIMKSGFNGLLLNKVISPNVGLVELMLFREDGLDASVLPIDNRPIKKRYKVEAITLDQADQIFGCQNNILLWMDIEGAELMAFNSAPKLMQSKRVKYINLEVRENPPWSGGCKASQIDSFLVDLGYKKVIEYNKHPHVGHYDVIYSLN